MNIPKTQHNQHRHTFPKPQQTSTNKKQTPTQKLTCRSQTNNNLVYMTHAHNIEIPKPNDSQQQNNKTQHKPSITTNNYKHRLSETSVQLANTRRRGKKKQQSGTTKKQHTKLLQQTNKLPPTDPLAPLFFSCPRWPVCWPERLSRPGKAFQRLSGVSVGRPQQAAFLKSLESFCANPRRK